MAERNVAMAGPGVAPQERPGVTVYRVSGMGCLDCASEIQDAIAHLPGVAAVDFNPIAGRLVVTGQANLAAIQAIAQTEGWTVVLQAGAVGVTDGAAEGEAASAQPVEPRPWWQQTRQRLLALAAGLLAVGLVWEWVGLAERLPGGELLARVIFSAAILAGIIMPARSAWSSLRRRRITINTLLVVGTIGAVALGLWEEAASLVVIFSLGEVMEVFASDRARRHLKALMDLAPPSALVLRDGVEQPVPVERIQAGELIRIKPGSRVPLDGEVQEGMSAVDEAAITGESIPVDKRVGDRVFAGTMNQHGTLTMRVTAAAADTTLAQIIRTVEEARARKSTYENFSERFGAVYTPAMFVLAGLVAFLAPLLLGQPFAPWLYRALVVLVISCSCGLVLSVPVAVLAAISNGARRGLIVKGGAYLEAADAIDTVALDKTGTLTEGRPEVIDVVPLGVLTPAELMRLAAGVEANSEHPLAAAVMRRAAQDEVSVPTATAFTALPGRGARAMVDGVELWVGSPRLATEQGVAPRELAAITALEAEGKTTIALWREGTVLGVLGFQDPLRAEAAEAVARLKARGVRHIVMLTGDNRRTAEALARQAGITEVAAELLPEDKIRAVRELQARGRRVAMVGDGINDGPALAQADLGIAMGVRGTDVARETSDVVVMDDDLRRLADTLTLGRQATRTIRQNVYLSVSLVAVLVPVALLGWVGLVPAITINEGSALLVIANGLRLLYARIQS